jgi:predicted metal-dependent phosphoesterase TrpH
MILIGQLQRGDVIGQIGGVSDHQPWLAAGVEYNAHRGHHNESHRKLALARRDVLRWNWTSLLCERAGTARKYCQKA